MAKKKTGTQEWADTTLNIASGCEHQCRYCYARQMKVVRFKQIAAEDWPHMKVNQEVVDAPRGKYHGSVMIPSMHDITPSILSEFLCVLRKLLDAGNDVLIVTKPHWECITTICDFYGEYKDQIMFRFTIGSTDDSVLKFWEPGAPNFDMRLGCLHYAHAAGFKTSVSCEPYLDAYPVHTYQACKPYLTDSFWIGKLKHFGSRVVLDGASDEEKAKFVEPLRNLQGDWFVKAIHNILDGQEFIKWKDSITVVVGKDVE